MAELKPNAIKVDETVTTNNAFTVWNFEDKYQDENHVATFREVSRDIKRGLTFTEAVQRSSDITPYLPDVYLAGVMEMTQNKSKGRQFANQYGAPEGQPKFFYRKHERWIQPQIVGEDDEFKARKGKLSEEGLEFPTIGDRLSYTWQSVKDLPIDQVAMDLRAVGAMIGLTEDRLVCDALYDATTADNNNVYVSNANTLSSYIELLRWKARMGAPTETSHPDLDPIIRDGLCNVYDPNVLVLPPSEYETLLTDTTLHSQAFWNQSKILDNGAIETAFGLTIYRMPTGYYSAIYEWTPTKSIYLIDTTLGGVDLVTKEPLQVVNWDIYENRRGNTMVYERVNSVVRNPWTVFRIELGGGS